MALVIGAVSQKGGGGSLTSTQGVLCSQKARIPAFWLSRLPEIWLSV